MKKILLFFVFFILFAMKADAKTDWVEFAPKMYYDQNTIETNELYVNLWMKALWGSAAGPKQYIKGRQPWYHIAKITIICSDGNNKLRIGRTITYDLNQNVLSEYEGWDEYTIYPDSVAELYFVDKFCPAAREIRRNYNY